MVRLEIVVFVFSIAASMVGFGQAADPKKELPKTASGDEARKKLTEDLLAEQKKIRSAHQVWEKAALVASKALEEAGGAAELRAAKSLRKAVEIAITQGIEFRCGTMLIGFSPKGALGLDDWISLRHESDRNISEYEAMLKVITPSVEAKDGLKGEPRREMEKLVESLRSLRERQNKIRGACRDACKQLTDELLKELNDDPKPPKKP